MITKENITDAQIRSLRALVLTEGSPWDAQGYGPDEIAEDCDVALGGQPRGSFYPRSTASAIIQTQAARARCAEIINARDKDVAMLTGATITDDQIRELRDSASDHGVTVICKEALGLLPCNACKTRRVRGFDGNCPSCANERTVARARCAAMLNERYKVSP